MSISIFDLFSIGIGPSSSHTVGPMRAAKQFLDQLQAQHCLKATQRVQVDLYGSLALTGKGHGTDTAVLNGLVGFCPESVDPPSAVPRRDRIIHEQKIELAHSHAIPFHVEHDLCFHQDSFLPKHANGLSFSAFDDQGQRLLTKTYYSIGGGFIVEDENFDTPLDSQTNVPYPFTNAKQLLHHCEQQQQSIAEIIYTNEKTWHSEEDIAHRLQQLIDVMLDSIERGCMNTGTLPGGLQVQRRAPTLLQKLDNHLDESKIKGSATLNWLSVYAMAVNEENAAGGRIVTAPTNGAAGIIPAVLKYYLSFYDGTPQGCRDFLLTAGAIALLYKKGASISAAEVGCQGEIGVASSMAAGALTAVLGGSIWQVENAAEIAMEHHLGLTCDPIKGLVQIPCIERNTMGAVKAVNAAQLALLGEGQHKVPLDTVIATMLQTGKDMQSKYKETAQGGLAVNLPEC